VDAQQRGAITSSGVSWRRAWCATFDLTAGAVAVRTEVLAVVAEEAGRASTDVDFGGGPVHGGLPARWIHGAPPGVRCQDPPLQVHRFDEHTFVLRQSKALTYEAPFLYLLFGNDRALLLDTGDVADPQRMPLRATVDHLIEAWLARHPRPAYALVVAHTHGHGDHVGGDGQFADRPATTVVGREPQAVREFFGFTSWPRQTVRFSLGGRVLEVTGSPGHHAASVTIFDPWSGFLLTGDTVYPGRLYVNDPAAFAASLEAMVTMARTRAVRAVLGCHIEMTRTPGRDYPIGTRYQPDEPPLAMTVEQLHAVHDAARGAAGQPGVHVFDDFAIYNGRCGFGMIRQRLRRAAQTTRQRLRPGHRVPQTES
jgi:glyoxylase-like metal-dependent hydrolase (beta-lactamase superfamily II)